MTNPKYRPDIDGLRAVAVLAVILFHFSPRFSGGFVGVDIFFVISGYLITDIIGKQISNNNFSYFEFYSRRIKRLFPALLAVLVFGLSVAWLFFFSSELLDIAKHILASSLFIENIYLWLSADYFSIESIFIPYLHLWSLGVEEQFYIFWPIFISLILKFKLDLIKSLLWILLVSFLANLFFTIGPFSAQTAFYLPVTRFWELAAGALLALQSNHNRDTPFLKNVLATIGGILVVVSFWFAREVNYPGWQAIMPVLGVSMLIYAGSQAFINKYLLSLKPVVWIGLISYPLYLWHWVLWSFANILFGRNPDVFNIGGHLNALFFLAISIVAAWLTYLFIESPIRKSKNIKTVFMLAVLMVFVALVAILIIKHDGMFERKFKKYNESAQSYLNSSTLPKQSSNCMDLLRKSTEWHCILGNIESEETILVFGDSHAQVFLDVFDKIGKSNNKKVVFTGVSGNLLLLDTYKNDSLDRVYAQKTIEKLKGYISQEKIVLAINIQHWNAHKNANTHIIHADNIQGIRAIEEGLNRTATYFSANNIPLVFMADFPKQRTTIPKHLMRFHAIDEKTVNATAVTISEHQQAESEMNSIIKAVTTKFNNVFYVNLDSEFCADERCPWVKNNQLLYFDRTHLSAAGAELSREALRLKLEEVFKVWKSRSE
ncbi:acyltransferase family protein [Acinetobacter towneri]|uniref:acyltransferase family protein n=1 Tax=Acinetobacter towneri TaxID=202956 RepID=UPI0014448FEB|nr:acyltransferase family protein [Acinetobacter towneri]